MDSTKYKKRKSDIPRQGQRNETKSTVVAKNEETIYLGVYFRSR